MNESCIMAVKAASNTVCDYCGNRSDVGDVLTAFSAALTAFDDAAQIASNLEIPRGDRVSAVIDHLEIFSAMDDIASWDREDTRQLVAILLVYFAEARLRRENGILPINL
ncbi:MAG: hypothetical protein GWP10_20315 [Nitrospiraceae bacterium]|nr:hypothetical protein [Nitrospiraceae bacterium]